MKFLPAGVLRAPHRGAARSPSFSLSWSPSCRPFSGEAKGQRVLPDSKGTTSSHHPEPSDSSLLAPAPGPGPSAAPHSCPRDPALPPAQLRRALPRASSLFRAGTKQSDSHTA